MRGWLLDTNVIAELTDVTSEIAVAWGVISGTVKRMTGHPPPVIDTLLAATAMRSSLYLATRNVRDVRHSGAAVFNPWLDDIAGFPMSRRSGRKAIDIAKWRIR
jgi:predicted nucleic acid-binding protein